MARLSRGKFGRLLFGPMLGGRKLRLERFDMGFERADDLIGQRSFIRIPEAAGARPSIRTTSFQPSGRPNPRSLVVSERLLPRPRFARWRTASVDTLNSSAACL